MSVAGVAATLLEFVDVVIKVLPETEDVIKQLYDDFVQAKGLTNEQLDEIHPAQPDTHAFIDAQVDVDMEQDLPHEKKP